VPEMLDLLWLLLPVAALSGWWIGRRTPRSQRAPLPCQDINTEYFRGLNFLLNEQPDKAIEVFIRMVEVDNETVETHLALGNLFRRRGEVDRAIRIHQNLIARPTLDMEQRGLALLELGQDYMRAGLLDRAEGILREVDEKYPAHSVRALRLLLEIYQQEKEWESAIEIARRLEKATRASRRSEIAQFECELAEAAIAEGDPGRAQQHVKLALAADRDCARATMLSGRLLLESGHVRQALRTLRRIGDQDPMLIPEALPMIRDAFERLGDRKGYADYLDALVEKGAGISVVLERASQLRHDEGDEAAKAYLADHLARRPTLRGLACMVELDLGLSDGENRENLELLKRFMQQLLEKKPRYRCRHCGFEGQNMHWRCPSCKKWDTVRPVQGVEGE